MDGYAVFDSYPCSNRSNQLWVLPKFLPLKCIGQHAAFLSHFCWPSTEHLCVCVCVCVRACVHVCVRACVCANIVSLITQG